MTPLSFLTDLTVVLVVSAGVTLLFHQLKLPFIFGYLLAGLLIGPHAPPFSLIQHVDSVHALAELGLLFLMFSLGLEIRLRRLREVGWTAGFATVLEVLLMTWLGYVAGRLMGWGHPASLFLGGTLSISSTTLISRILKEHKQWNAPHAKLILGILVMEDVLAVMMIAALSGLASAGTLEMGAVVLAGAKVGAFITGVLVFGRLVMPAVLDRLERVQSSELILAAVLGLCFGISALAISLGFSVALGAFLTGLVVSEWRGSQSLASLVHPFRDVFSPIFFVAVGMLIVPEDIWRMAGPILWLGLVVVLGKISSVAIGTFLSGAHPLTSFQVGCGLATIGEFSFVIAKLGVSSGMMPVESYTLVVAVSLGTSLVVSFLVPRNEGVAGWVRKIVPPSVYHSATLYHAWFQAIRWPSWRISWMKVIHDRLVPLLASTIGLIGVLWWFPYGERWISQTADQAWRLGLRVVLWVISGLALLFPLLTWASLVRAVGLDLRVPGSNFMFRAAQFIAVVLFSMVLLAAGSPFMAPWPLMMVVGGLLGGAGYLLWNSMSEVEEKIEERVREWFSSPGITEHTRQELIAAVQHRYPWTVEFQDVMLPWEWPHGVFSLGALKLNETTGTTVLAIFREHEEMVNPTLATMLAPADILLVVGERPQIQVAMKYLEKCGRHAAGLEAGADWGMDVILVQDDSSWKGQALQALLKEMGDTVKVMGSEADRWVVLGERAAIQKVKQTVEFKIAVAHDDEWLYRRVFDQR